MAVSVVVGLGNDEPRYAYSLHNIGFQAIDLLAVRWKWGRHEKKEYALFRDAMKAGVLVRPHSLMNVSGPKVREALRDHRAGAGDLLVVCDDFALPWGKLRFRTKGSSGGHNGLASVIETLGTQEFARLRVGVGPVLDGVDPKDFVLAPRPKARIHSLAGLAADALAVALTDGLETAMNRYNASPVV